MPETDRPEHRREVLEDVRERKIRHDVVVRLERQGLGDRFDLPQDVPVREHRPLGRPRRPRGVDDHRDVVRVRPGERRIEPLRAPLQERLPLLHEVLEEAHALVGESPEPLAVPDDDPLHRRLADDREDLLELLLVVEEEIPGPRVLEEVSHLLGGRRGVDPARRAARRHRAHVAVEPLGPVVAEDGDSLPAGQTRRQEAAGHPPDRLSVLVPGHALPDAVDLVSDRERGPPCPHLREEELGERASRRCDRLHHHRLRFR